MGCGSSINVKIDPPKKRLPFNKESKICVIGGGAGGVHMATLLKKKGYSNITILEKEQKIGGKANTITVNNHRYDTGTVFTYSHPHVVDVLRDADLFHQVHPIDSKISEFYTKKSGKRIPKLEYAKEVTNINSLINLKLTLDSQLEKYQKLFKTMTDEYGFPKEEYMHEMVKPIHKFFHDHGLTALDPLVESRLKSQGYDRGDIMVFNSMFFLDPEYLKPDAILYQFKGSNGWQDVWENLVKKYELNVEYNKRVDQVEWSYENNNLKISVFDTVSNSTEERIFDFAVMAHPEPLKLLKNPSYLQKEYLEKFNRFCPVVTSIYKIKNKHKVNFIFDKESDYVKGNFVGAGFYRKVISDEENTVDVAYQYFKRNNFVEEKDIEEIERNLREHVKGIVGEEVDEIVTSKINNYYLPHCSDKDISAGVPWELFRLQGENKIWFTSAFTCFDLTQSIICYNMKLLDKYAI